MTAMFKDPKTGASVPVLDDLAEYRAYKAAQRADDLVVATPSREVPARNRRG